MYNFSTTKCHEGTVFAFKDPISQIKFFGGGRTKGVKVEKHQILIDVGINLDQTIEVSGIRALFRLSKRYNVKKIKIDWDDQGAPDLPRAFWIELVNSLRKERRDIVVACVGGHGRTGTALSILCNLILKEKDPITFIRKHYCEEAVESQRQINYIEEICNIDTSHIKPAWRPSVYSGKFVHYGYDDETGNFTQWPKINATKGDKK